MSPEVTAPSPSPWAATFEDLSCEHGFLPLRVEGRVPGDLRGTLYRNGSARFGLYGRRYGHWFDGDGAVTAVLLGAGGVQGAVRLVQTQARATEERTRRLSNAGYGTQAPSTLLQIARILTGRPAARNTANTSVVLWGRRLFALCESGRPFELSTDDLHTLGERDLGGVVAHTFSAHPHRAPRRGAIYNFGVRYGRETLLDLYELQDRGIARRLGRPIPLCGPTMVHDFIATERHLIFLCPPLRAQMGRLLLGQGTFEDNLRWQPAEGTEVLLVPIDAPDRPLRFRAEPFFQWHFASAWERGDEICVDLVRHADFETGRWLAGLYRDRDRGGPQSDAGGRLTRLVIDRNGRAGPSLRTEASWDVPCEFPQVAPADEAGAFAYVATHGPASLRGLPDGLARVDLASGKAAHLTLPPGHYPSEGVFAPRPGGAGPDDGYVLSLVFYKDGAERGTYLAGFDARRLEDGPVFRAHFAHPIPYTFHGVWAPA
jgi:all-trans-8'-apo-beta-carotenal 15,15'-oxygenase